jgi:hypothetical protein
MFVSFLCHRRRYRIFQLPFDCCRFLDPRQTLLYLSIDSLADPEFLNAFLSYVPQSSVTEWLTVISHFGADNNCSLFLVTLRVLMPYSEEPAALSYSEPAEFNPYSHTVLILPSHICLCVPRCLLQISLKSSNSHRWKGFRFFLGLLIYILAVLSCDVTLAVHWTYPSVK